MIAVLGSQRHIKIVILYINLALVKHPTLIKIIILHLNLALVKHLTLIDHPPLQFGTLYTSNTHQNNPPQFSTHQASDTHQNDPPSFGNHQASNTHQNDPPRTLVKQYWVCVAFNTLFFIYFTCI